jgi:hypothetical protein
MICAAAVSFKISKIKEESEKNVNRRDMTKGSRVMPRHMGGAPAPRRFKIARIPAQEMGLSHVECCDSRHIEME